MADKKKKKPSPRITEEDYLKAMRRASRELEIELHGRQVSLSAGRRVHDSRKTYKRSRDKHIEI